MSLKPKNIVHLITELNMGGAEEMLYKLVTRMDHNRFRCFVVSMTDTGPIGVKIKDRGIPVVPLGMGHGKPTLSGLAKLFHFLKQESVDIVQTWLYHADLLGFVVGRMAGIKRVIWGIRCSDMHLRKYRRLTALTVRICGGLSSLVDAIVVNSEEGKRIHKKRGYQTERMILIPNGFDMNQFRYDESAKTWLTDQLDLPDDMPLIGLVARFDPQKDQRTFLKAASLLASRDQSVNFVMVGKGMDRHNAALVPLLEDKAMKGRVHLLGLRHDIPRIVPAFDIATSSSAFGEGFSNTIGEAMSCQVPCVVTDVGDSAKIVGDTGIIVPPGDPEALAEGWLKLLNMGKDKRQDMGKKARLRIVDNFEINKVVKRFEEFYEKL